MDRIWELLQQPKANQEEKLRFDLKDIRHYFPKAVFAEALSATAKHRGTKQQIADVPAILQNIEESPELKTMWDKYRKQFAYAADIEYGQIIQEPRVRH